MTLTSRFIGVFAGLRSVAADIIPPNPFALIATALAFLMVGGICAFAQDGSAPVAAASFSDTLAKISGMVESFAIIVGCAFALLTGAPLVSGAIGLLGVKDATQRAQLEKLFNDRLHSAIQNAIQFAVTKSGLPISAVTLGQVLSDAVAYLQDKNPDTISFFKLEAKQLEDLVTANWPTVFNWLNGPSSALFTVPPAADSSGVDATGAAVQTAMKVALQVVEGTAATTGASPPVTR
ncbi:hypothetical protein [Rhizobium sp. 11_C7_N12_5]|uniref:hypothetical protein n=1 Tax=Rhizobium sp. 11_C7_N12_5 TaxID=3240770 RepID=UPI003F2887A2